MVGTIAGVLALLLAAEIAVVFRLIQKDRRYPVTKIQLIVGAMLSLLAIGFGTAAVVGLQSAPAGEAIGWSRHSEKVVGSLITNGPTIITTRHTVQVEGRGTWLNGQTIDYSCPPNWQQIKAPACKQNSVIELCAKGCASPMRKLTIPFAVLSFMIGSLLYVVPKVRQ